MSIQAGEAFPVTVIFKPKLKMMEQCAKYLVDVDKGIFEIPMKVRGGVIIQKVIIQGR